MVVICLNDILLTACFITILFITLPNLSFGTITEKEIEPFLYNPDSKPYNVTLPEWTAEWWKWAYSFSGYKNNTLLDPNGTLLMKYQPHNEPMFFLTGAWNSVANRTVDIPSNKSIFFPVLIAEASYASFPSAKSEDDLKKILDSDLSAATYIGAEINGTSVPHQRITTSLFDTNYATNNIFGPETGLTEAMADGYWVFLKPLPPGHYNIHLKGEQPFYRTEVTYDLNVFNP